MPRRGFLPPHGAIHLHQGSARVLLSVCLTHSSAALRRLVAVFSQLCFETDNMTSETATLFQRLTRGAYFDRCRP